MTLPTLLPGLPDYRRLDLTGQGLAAAKRIEARAREPASEALFDSLVRPLLGPDVRRVLEVGCGTAALGRRIAQVLPHAQVLATDKSEAMLHAARQNLPLGSTVHLQAWDVLDDAAFPFDAKPFDLIVSAVMMPYLGNAECAHVIQALAARLGPGGALVFLEQDLHTDALHLPDFALWRQVMGKDRRDLKASHALGLRPLLRDAGLRVAPDRTFVWTDTTYGPYLRDLLGQFASDARRDGRIDDAGLARWHHLLEAQVIAGDFWYGLVYHAVVGHKG